MSEIAQIGPVCPTLMLNRMSPLRKPYLNPLQVEIKNTL